MLLLIRCTMTNTLQLIGKWRKNEKRELNVVSVVYLYELWIDLFMPHNVPKSITLLESPNEIFGAEIAARATCYWF